MNAGVSTGPRDVESVPTRAGPAPWKCVTVKAALRRPRPSAGEGAGAEPCRDAGQQPVAVHRLDEVVVGPGVEALELCLHVAPRREENDGDEARLRQAAQLAADVDPALVGEHDV